eukprot:TRINITY_DN9016_c0_g1_i1.p1 TRINITY_DN9016_c0_g1~~TRINITY_DN9016_c0_g1_i1.p1  ORF type:complete len:164 (+),score=27.32 TRINITY_DN9016_c0_g1_i1:68-493(+)
MISLSDFENMSFNDAQQRVGPRFSAPQPSDLNALSSMMMRMSLAGGERPNSAGMTYEQMLALDENNVKRGVKPREWAKVIKEERASRKDAKETDPITQDEFKPGEQVAKIKKCGHRFKVDGLKQWFKKEHKCPVCRCDVLE